MALEDAAAVEATRDEIAQYEERGYFVRRAVFQEDELHAWRAATEGIHRAIVEAAERPDAKPPELIDGKRYQPILESSVQWEWDGSQEIRSMEPYHHLDAGLDAMLDDPRLWGPTRALIGARELSLFSDKLNFKRPGGAPFPWHQDNPYWAFECDHLDQLVSVLIVLDEATVDNGCLWVVPGSHKRGALPCYEERGVVGRLYTEIEKIEGLEAPVALEVPAGSLVYFHGDILHGNQGNRTDASRRALVVTFQPAGLPRWQQEAVRDVAGSLSA